MIKLNLPREPHWITLAAGVRLQVRPATTALVMAARHAASKITGADNLSEQTREAPTLDSDVDKRLLQLFVTLICLGHPPLLDLPPGQVAHRPTAAESID